ncbi:hypothetical protein JVU11DRAFT_10198 [Chiua virens]|nr:hypothetical protein JVU11DRAFT_10198 [Chiua virens]
MQPSQYVNPSQGATPLVLPTVLPSAQEDGDFYDSYILDGYTEEYVSPTSISHPPTSQAQASTSPVQKRQSPAAVLPNQQPQPQAQEQQGLPTWIQPAPSPSRTSSNTNSSSGHGRAPSRTANMAMIHGCPHMAADMNMGADVVVIEPSPSAVNVSSPNMGRSVSNGTLRRKPTRRPTVRRVPVYDDENDDGFVNDELEMATIRVKLHHQGDVRGMTMSPLTSFEEFVERVTTKFETSLTGLGMKFVDEDGTKITLRDESDFELAIETARDNGKGKSEGKIEVWCVDVS